MYFINVLKNVFEQFRKFSGPALENDRFVREEHWKCEILKLPLRFSYVN